MSGNSVLALQGRVFFRLTREFVVSRAPLFLGRLETCAALPHTVT